MERIIVANWLALSCLFAWILDLPFVMRGWGLVLERSIRDLADRTVKIVVGPSFKNVLLFDIF